MLIRGLPADAATTRALAVEANWSATDYLLANVLDTLRAANWLTVELNKRKNARNPYPNPVPRPGDQTDAPVPMSGFEFAEWLEGVG